jgi:hypothetical protein
MISGCASPTANYTKYQKEIDMKQQKLQEDAKDFIATAKNILNKTDLKRSEIKRAISIIEKSQTLLGAKIDDGSEFKDLSIESQDKAIEETFKESKKDLEEIEVLEEKDKELVSEIVNDNVKNEIIKNYETKKSLKFYTILLTILGGLGTLTYFFPTQTIGIGLRIVGFVKNLIFK